MKEIKARDGYYLADPQKENFYKAVKGECDGQPYSIAYPLAPYGVAVFEF